MCKTMLMISKAAHRSATPGDRADRHAQHVGAEKLDVSGFVFGPVSGTVFRKRVITPSGGGLRDEECDVDPGEHALGVHRPRPERPQFPSILTRAPNRFKRHRRGRGALP
jgi:hypothetical protein